jgi:hypothetical protein
MSICAGITGFRKLQIFFSAFQAENYFVNVLIPFFGVRVGRGITCRQ